MSGLVKVENVRRGETQKGFYNNIEIFSKTVKGSLSPIKGIRKALNSGKGNELYSDFSENSTEFRVREIGEDENFKYFMIADVSRGEYLDDSILIQL